MLETKTYMEKNKIDLSNNIASSGDLLLSPFYCVMQTYVG